jgi:hypothetical protein
MPRRASLRRQPRPEQGKKTAFFQSLWDDATEALREPRLIVFIGYRFPPTDTEAARRLLAAIADNTTRRSKGLLKEDVEVELALGNDGPSLGRLRALLEGAGITKIIDRKFYSTDYLLTESRVRR